MISDHNPGIALSYDPNPRAPEAVKASKGNYADKVRVTWDEVPNGPAYTSYYQVYRSLSPNGIKAPVSPWLDIPNFEDNTALSGVTYYYWIRSAISQAGLSPGQYSTWDTGRTSDSYQPTLTLSSSCGGSIVLPGEGVFVTTLSQKVPVQAVPMDTSLYVFSHWTGTAVDAGKVADPYASSTSVTADGDYTLRAQFVSLLETLYVDDDVSRYSIENGSFSFPLKHIADALEVASDRTTVRVSPGFYSERLELGDKTVRLFGYDPNNPIISPFPVIDGNDQGPVISVTGDEYCWLSGFVITGGLAESGSALACDGGRLEMTHCLVVGNRATNPTGGVVCCRDGSARFINCTMTDNLGGMILMDSDVEILNTILWGNTNGDLHWSGQAVPVIRYCDVGGGGSLTSGNFDANPLFVRPGIWLDGLNMTVAVNPYDVNAVWFIGDYHLRSAFGCWDEDSQEWLFDSITSVCIDGGDPSSHVGHEPESNGGRVNMGVYGGTSQASRSVN